MKIESEEEIWKKVRLRKQQILKDMGRVSEAEIQKVVIFKDVEHDSKHDVILKEDDESMVDQRLIKEIAGLKDENARLKTENSVLQSQERLRKQDEQLKELEKARMERESGNAETRISKYLDSMVMKGMSRSDAILKAMSDPEFQELYAQYSQEYEAERKQQLAIRAEEAGQ